MSAAASSGYRAWAGSTALSALGDAVTFFALGWVAAGHGPGTASAVLVAESVPLCALILLGGAVADRWGVRRVLVGCDLAMALVMGTFAAGAGARAPSWSLVVVAAVSGTVAALRRPAAGVVPHLFARGDELGRLMAGLTLLLQAARLSGPVVAGALLATGGLRLTSAIDAASFALVGAVLLAVHPPHGAEPGPERAGTLVAAARVARATRGVPAAMLATCCLAAALIPLVELCVPLLGHHRGWGSSGTAGVAAGWPLGGMVVMAAVSRRGIPPPHLAASGPVVSILGVAMLAAAPRPAVGLLALALVGVGTSLTTARLLPRFVVATPPGQLARFQAFLGLAQTGPVLVVTPLLGAVAGRVGVTTTLVVVVGVLAASVPAVRRAELLAD